MKTSRETLNMTPEGVGEIRSLLNKRRSDIYSTLTSTNPPMTDDDEKSARRVCE